MDYLVGILTCAVIIAVLVAEAAMTEMTALYIGGLAVLMGYYVFGLVTDNSSSET